MAASTPPIRYPRVAIEFCVQCKWNLRAAYFAQELLQTFSTSIGEISLIPVTGGIFTITLYHQDTPESQVQSQSQPNVNLEDIIPLTDPSLTPITTSMIWDRKRDGGFPETKELKNRVRNIIEPGRDMGHVDRALRKGKGDGVATKQDITGQGEGRVEESSKGDKGGLSNVQVPPSEQTSQSEKRVSSHAEHKDAGSALADCEECRGVLENEGGF